MYVSAYLAAEPNLVAATPLAPTLRSRCTTAEATTACAKLRRATQLPMNCERPEATKSERGGTRSAKGVV